MRIRRLVLSLIAVLGLASVSLAAAQDVTRAQYIAQVDPICKRTDHRLNRVFRDFGESLDQDQHQRSARILRQAARIYERSLDDVGSVDPPAQDADLIARWLGFEHRDVGVTRRMADAQEAGDIHGYNRLVDKSRALEHHINATIGDYGFKRCN